MHAEILIRIIQDFIDNKSDANRFIEAFEHQYYDRTTIEDLTGEEFKSFDKLAYYVGLCEPDDAIRSESSELLDVPALIKHAKIAIKELNKDPEQVSV